MICWYKQAYCTLMSARIYAALSLPGPLPFSLCFLASSFKSSKILMHLCSFFNVVYDFIAMISGWQLDLCYVLRCTPSVMPFWHQLSVSSWRGMKHMSSLSNCQVPPTNLLAHESQLKSSRFKIPCQVEWCCWNSYFLGTTTIVGQEALESYEYH